MYDGMVRRLGDQGTQANDSDAAAAREQVMRN